MRIIAITIEIIFVISSLFCCSQSMEKDPKDIKGIWAVTINDSVYEEVIITDTTFYLHDEVGGDIGFRYELTHDSIKIFNFNVLQSARKYTRLNKDEFMEHDEGFKAHFFRLTEYGDTAKILGIDTISSDSEYFNKYIKEKRTRQYNWDLSKKTNR
jgi:hypothetical protein